MDDSDEPEGVLKALTVGALVVALGLSIVGPILMLTLAVLAARFDPWQVSWPIVGLVLTAIGTAWLPFVEELRSEWLEFRKGIPEWIHSQEEEERETMGGAEPGEVSREGELPEIDQLPEADIEPAKPMEGQQE